MFIPMLTDSIVAWGAGRRRRVLLSDIGTNRFQPHKNNAFVFSKKQFLKPNFVNFDENHEQFSFRSNIVCSSWRDRAPLMAPIKFRICCLVFICCRFVPSLRTCYYQCKFVIIWQNQFNWSRKLTKISTI